MILNTTDDSQLPGLITWRTTVWPSGAHRRRLQCNGHNTAQSYHPIFSLIVLLNHISPYVLAYDFDLGYLLRPSSMQYDNPTFPLYINRSDRLTQRQSINTLSPDLTDNSPPRFLGPTSLHVQASSDPSSSQQVRPLPRPNVADRPSAF